MLQYQETIDQFNGVLYSGLQMKTKVLIRTKKLFQKEIYNFVLHQPAFNVFIYLFIYLFSMIVSVLFWHVFVIRPLFFFRSLFVKNCIFYCLTFFCCFYVLLFLYFLFLCVEVFLFVIHSFIHSFIYINSDYTH